MVKVRIQAGKEAFEQAAKDGGGDFVVPKPGVYVLTMEACNHGFSKTDGEPDQAKPRLECVYTITGVGPEEAPTTENYGKLWDYVSFSESSGWKRAEFLKAFKLADEGATSADVSVDTDDFVNRKVLARLKHEKGQNAGDPPRAKVARLIAYGSDLSGGALDDSATDYGTDTGPSGDIDEPFGAEAEPEMDVTMYTVDSLEELDLKGLGAILKDEFGGDPTAHIVKGKDGKLDKEETKTAVVNAILEAQGDGVETGNTEDDDENPF